MNLTKSQYKTARSFMNDVAKGVMIAVILGQSVLLNSSLEIKIYANMMWFVISIFFFFSAMMLSKHI
ncbi:MAG: hypothetical protein AAB778_00250 [Patescibacteria group bacterium]